MSHLLLLIGLLSGCNSDTITFAQQCDVVLSELTPDAGLSGTSVSAAGRPMTTVWDTAVYVGDQRASLVDVARDSCDDCDSCRSRENCDGCDDCDECDEVCSTCVESVTFIVPALESGSFAVSMYNRHGQSTSVPFSVLGSADTGLTDTGPTDTGPTDTGASDTGDLDTGSTDSDTSSPTDDSGATGEPSGDSGSADAPFDDTGTADSGEAE